MAEKVNRLSHETNVENLLGETDVKIQTSIDVIVYEFCVESWDLDLTSPSSKSNCKKLDFFCENVSSK